MRLLNVHSGKLEEYFDDGIPKYAILSHTWGRDEVSFQDLVNDRHTEKLGYAKIKGCCEQAIRDGYTYVWIDTCCIDKSSSAELSESINSMFKWYASAGVCYAYLVDVSSGEDPYLKDSTFRKSLWFTRGWTLQELLAPRSVIFFDTTWIPVLEKHSGDEVDSNDTGVSDDRKVLAWDLLADITGIDRTAVSQTRDFKSTPVAVRFCWASKRRTTRVEDRAYCLLGLLDVNMPLLYGEGKRSFIRLQEEVIRTSSDLSILAWGFGMAWQDIAEASRDHFLASSIEHFQGCSQATFSGEVDDLPFQIMRSHSTVTNRGLSIKVEHLPFQVMLSHSTVTNHGLSIKIPLISIDDDSGIVLAIINIMVYDYVTPRYTAIPLRRKGPDIFERAGGSVPVSLKRPFRSRFQLRAVKWRRIYIQAPSKPDVLPILRLALQLTLRWSSWNPRVLIRTNELFKAGYYIRSFYPPSIRHIRTGHNALDLQCNACDEHDPGQHGHGLQFLLILSKWNAKNSTVAFLVEYSTNTVGATRQELKEEYSSWKVGLTKNHKAAIAHADESFLAMQYPVGPKQSWKLFPAFVCAPKLDWQQSIVLGDRTEGGQGDHVSFKWRKRSLKEVSESSFDESMYITSQWECILELKSVDTDHT